MTVVFTLQTIVEELRIRSSGM